eukprot:403335741
MVSLLPDPTGDRMVSQVVPPPQHPISHNILFPESKKRGSQEVPDWIALKEHLLKEGRMHKKDLIQMIRDVTEIMKKEPNVLTVEEPAVIVGDIHGQYYDLVHLLDKAGDPSNLNYVFLGDYVDRGIYSLECLMLLFAIKLNFPANFYLLRGNHECRGITEHFTFRQEVLEKFDVELYDLIMICFDTMPLVAVVNQQYLCMHGGVSPLMKTLESVNEVNRFSEIPLEGLICDIVWADPIDDEIADKYEFMENPERACSFKYGLNPAKKLLDDNDLTLLVRAHQVQVQGYKMHYWEKPQSLPTVITIFSAPNYCDVYKNKAAVIKLEGENFSIKNYEEVPHPYHLPGGINLFQFSMPYLADKVLDMLLHILKKGDEDETFVSNMPDEDEIDFNKLLLAAGNQNDAAVMKNKINAVSRMRRMYKNLKENHDILLQIKMVNDGRIPRGLLLDGKPAIRNALKEFDLASQLDKENEKRPPRKM